MRCESDINIKIGCITLCYLRLAHCIKYFGFIFTEILWCTHFNPVSRYEDAYNFIVSKDENSWYNMLREGATTTFEAWGKDRKWNTSLCHPWATGPVSVLAEDILPNMPEKGILRYKKK